MRTWGRPRLSHTTGSNPTTRKQQTERPHVREQCPSRAPHSDVHHVCAGTTSRQAGRPTEFSFCRADTMLDTRRAATDVDRRSSSGAALEEPPFFHANPPRANTRNASAWVMRVIADQNEPARPFASTRCTRPTLRAARQGTNYHKRAQQVLLPCKHSFYAKCVESLPGTMPKLATLYVDMLELDDAKSGARHSVVTTPVRTTPAAVPATRHARTRGMRPRG